MQGVRVGDEQLLQLRAEVGYIGRETLLGDDRTAALLELLDGCAPHALRVVRRFGDGRQLADAVCPEGVAGVYAGVHIANLRAEDVVARMSDVRVCRQPGEQDGSVRLRERGSAQHRAAARGAEDNLYAVHVGQLPVGGDCALRAALGVLYDELQRASVYTARRVNLVERHLLDLVRHDAVSLAGAGQRLHHADAVGRLRVLAAASDEGEQGYRQQGECDEWLDMRGWHDDFTPVSACHLCII